MRFLLVFTLYHRLLEAKNTPKIPVFYPENTKKLPNITVKQL